MTDICFIGGTGRSGTTILRRIFGRHPHVAALRTEARFLIDPDGLVDFWDTFKCGWSPYTFDIKIRRLEGLLRELGRTGSVGMVASALGMVGGGASKTNPTEPTRIRRRNALKWAFSVDMRLARWLPRYPTVMLGEACPSYTELVDDLLASLIQFKFEGRWTGTPRFQPSTIFVGPRATDDDLAGLLGDFYRDVAGCIAAQSGATHFVEDSPLNILSFDRILELLPDARLVHIYRDPRDVVASYSTMRWGPPDPAQTARLYARIMEAWNLVRRKLPPESYLEVALEELVQNPKITLDKICNLWGLPWSDTLLDTDLSGSHSGRWKKDLTTHQQQAIMTVVQPLLTSLGYAPTPPSASTGTLTRTGVEANSSHR